MLTVLVDIDNVLNNFCEECVNKYNKDNNTNYSYLDVNTYDIATSLGIKDFDNFLHNYLLSTDVVNNVVPLSDSVKYLKQINNFCELYIVTARSWEQLANVYKWFQKYFPFIEDRQIIRCQNKRMIKGDILIDDSLDNILDFPAGRILFDYPWNRDIEDITNFIYRVHNWKECFELFKLIVQPKGILKL